eukprot:253347-Hanusia_phi.AAC.1
MLTTTPHALACYFGALMKLHSMGTHPSEVSGGDANARPKERVAILGAGVGGSAVPLSVLFDEVECV